MNTGWNLSDRDYAAMRARHPQLWEHALRWMQRHAPRSVLEIGGGDGQIAQLLPPTTDYLNIDPNAGAAHPKTLRADWLAVGLGAYVGRFDVVISLGTINHVRNAYAFLDRILLVRPRAAYISLWVPLCDGPSVIQEEIIGGATTGGGTGHYIRTQFSRRSITAWCEIRRLSHSIERIGADDVLILEELRP